MDITQFWLSWIDSPNLRISFRLQHPYTAQTVTHVFVDSVVKLHGMPHSIVSDRDRIFTSSFWKLLFQQLGSKHVNQCLEMFLRCTVQESPRQWRRALPLAELYNSCFHTSLGCSPVLALYGHEPNFGAFPELEPDIASPVNGVLAERAAQIRVLQRNIEAAQLRMKKNADKHRTELEFQVDAQVLLRLQPYAQNSVVNCPFPKLAYKFFGPYSVLERNGAVAYCLDLPANTKIHNVFYVSQLKDYTPDYTPSVHWPASYSCSGYCQH
jgi:hypothetical protein